MRAHALRHGDIPRDVAEAERPSQRELTLPQRDALARGACAARCQAAIASVDVDLAHDRDK